MKLIIYLVYERFYFHLILEIRSPILQYKKKNLCEK